MSRIEQVRRQALTYYYMHLISGQMCYKQEAFRLGVLYKEMQRSEVECTNTIIDYKVIKQEDKGVIKWVA